MQEAAQLCLGATTACHMLDGDLEVDHICALTAVGPTNKARLHGTLKSAHLLHISAWEPRPRGTSLMATCSPVCLSTASDTTPLAPLQGKGVAIGRFSPFQEDVHRRIGQ